MDTILGLENISVAFPGVLALDRVSVAFKRGEVHALVGENGAGKSTLIKVCAGVNTPAAGRITWEGETYDSLTPSFANKLGIGIIYQELSLVNNLSVAENIFLGNALRKGLSIDRKSMEARAREIFEQLGIHIDPGVQVGELTVGFQQMVELARALVKELKLLILDEPTAPLTVQEVEKLFEVVELLKKRGVTIIYISHRMDEIFRICDRVTVLRDGEYVGTRLVRETPREELISMMVGRTIQEVFPQRIEHKRHEILLEAKNLYGNGLKDISFQLHKGEILGFGGLIGAGRTELAQLLFGVKRIERGKLLWKGQPVVIKNPRMAMDKGITLAPEDRKQQGLLLKMTVRDNISMAIIRKISRLSVVNRRQEKKLAVGYVKELSIKTADTDRQMVRTLSGGNQQKVCLAKCLATDPELIIMDEPTRGIDVAAKQEIYKLMTELVEEGKTIIMISSEMPELLGMSDRILVFCEGKMTGELVKEEFSQEKVLELASSTQ